MLPSQYGFTPGAPVFSRRHTHHKKNDQSDEALLRELLKTRAMRASQSPRLLRLGGQKFVALLCLGSTKSSSASWHQRFGCDCFRCNHGRLFVYKYI